MCRHALWQFANCRRTNNLGSNLTLSQNLKSHDGVSAYVLSWSTAVNSQTPSCLPFLFFSKPCRYFIPCMREQRTGTSNARGVQQLCAHSRSYSSPQGKEGRVCFGGRVRGPFCSNRQCMYNTQSSPSPLNKEQKRCRGCPSGSSSSCAQKKTTRNSFSRDLTPACCACVCVCVCACGDWFGVEKCAQTRAEIGCAEGDRRLCTRCRD